jgi:hypothetical protein
VLSCRLTIWGGYHHASVVGQSGQEACVEIGFM